MRRRPFVVLEIVSVLRQREQDHLRAARGVQPDRSGRTTSRRRVGKSGVADFANPRILARAEPRFRMQRFIPHFPHGSEFLGLRQGDKLAIAMG